MSPFDGGRPRREDRALPKKTTSKTPLSAKNKGELVRELRAQAVRKWARYVTGAREEMRAEIARVAGKGRWKDVTAADVISALRRHEEAAMQAVWWLGAVYALDEPSPDLQRRIAMVTKSVPGEGADDRTALAAAIVEEHADRYLPATERQRPGIARAMVETLGHACGAQLWQLSDKLADVCELLDRYRKTRPPKGKLSANQILVELNKLCGKPLGTWSFTAKSVAMSRKRKLR